VSFLVFFLARQLGDPLVLMLGEYSTEHDRELMAAALGLDKPFMVQYQIFLGNALHGDFGTSLRGGRPALELVLERFPATAELAVAGLLIALIIGVPVGVYAAVKRGTVIDMVARVFAICGQSIPIYWLGLMLILVFAVWLRLLPSAGRGGLEHLILPALTMGYYVVAGVMRLVRSSMLDVLSTEYIKFTRIKGLSERLVIWKHALRNAAIPVLTYVVMLFVMLLAGAVLTEVVFGWPGVGRLLMSSVQHRDFPVIQTVVILLSGFYLGANLIVDLLYAYLNPKIRFQR
ncbi:ABC transporter permease, partial [Chloroflexota bacterium]